MVGIGYFVPQFGRKGGPVVGAGCTVVRVRSGRVMRTYLSRLRRLLSPVGVTSEQRPTGYVLLADADCVDVHRFHRTSRSPTSPRRG